MKEPTTVRDYIEDIFESTSRIAEYIEGINYEQFKKDLKTQDAVIRAFEVLGEAAKKVPEKFRKKYPDIPWRKMAAMRDKLIHDYWGVNIERVWKTATEDISELREKLQNIQI